MIYKDPSDEVVAGIRPLRGEVLSRDRLAHRAAEQADLYSEVVKSGRVAPLKARFRDNCKVLNDAYFTFAEAVRADEPLAPGAEWLLDNFHVIDEQVKEIRRDLPSSYYKSLPKLVAKEWSGLPRVYHIACDIITNTDSVIDLESLTSYVQSYQTVRPLMIGEIWAIPIMLRLALVENLRRLAEQGLILSRERQVTERVCREIIDDPALDGAEILFRLIARTKARPEILEFGTGVLARRLRTRGAQAVIPLQWMEERLRDRGLTLQELSRLEQQAQAADQISVGNAVNALKSIGNVDWREWFESVSSVDRVLRNDPAALYANCDFETRDLYRHRIEKIAKLTGRVETDVASDVVAFAREQASVADEAERDRRGHIGYYLIGAGTDAFYEKIGFKRNLISSLCHTLRSYPLTIFLGAQGLVALLVVWLIQGYTEKLVGQTLFVYLLWPVLFLLATEFAGSVINWLSCQIIRPQPLPKLDYEKGIAANHKTAVVVQAIFNRQDAVENVLEQLAIRAVGNMDSEVVFGVLADLGDADSESHPGDLGIINSAVSKIRDMNERASETGRQPFFIMFRSRKWNESEQKWMGWERKRGKLQEFNRFILNGGDTSFNVYEGDVESIKGAKFVVTLDADTSLPAGSVRKLVGTIAHPLNRARFDGESDRIVDGYAIIQPRIGISLFSGSATLFARIFSGSSGLDPYTRTVSNVYQDVFGQASYVGKGIYEVASFVRALENRFPENSLLSHDLIEGIYARCGLASDIELFDDFPVRYHSWSRRAHRWIRGDWQVAHWIRDRVRSPTGMRDNDISALGRWKLIDNLRRSLIPIVQFFFLVIALAFYPEAAWLWFLTVVLLQCFPIVSGLINFVTDFPVGCSIKAYLSSVLREMDKNLRQVLLNCIFIPHQAAVSLSAISLTLYRTMISRRSLLEWETAASAERRLGNSLLDFVRSMSAGYTLILGAILVFWLSGSAPRPEVVSLIILWTLSPVVAYTVSLPRREGSRTISSDDREYLRGLAYSTWLYFDRHLDEKYNYLIPDNLQVTPAEVVAERTSPTNIGLSLLALMSAFDLGFIPITDTLRRGKKIYETLQRLERFQGHFLNWFNIRDLRPLHPRYVSTVDSGNLAGHLLAYRSAVLRSQNDPLISDKHLRFLRENASSAQSFASVSSVRSVKDLFSVLFAVHSSTAKDELRPFLELYDLVSWVPHVGIVKRLAEQGLVPSKLRAIDRVLVDRVPTLSLMAKLVGRLIKLETVFAQLPAELKLEAQTLISSLKLAESRLDYYGAAAVEISELSEQFIFEMDFRFLYDFNKKLLVIGFNVDNGQRDNSCYDLLASEARLASLIAIAKGDLPHQHWFHLGRGLTDSAGGQTLLSWSGTMFEYLMPIIVMKEYPGTILAETYRSVVRAQISYAKRRGVPWGISESAYSNVDFEKTYQYRAFGIPGLGLKRGLADDLVVSPYSTVLSLQVLPDEAVSNLRLLERQNVRGMYGFYEAVDYTPTRLSVDEERHVVQAFFAHHQGMSLAAINNLLNDGVLQQRFHDNEIIQACELLLQEKFPNRIPIIIPHQAEVMSVGRDTKDDRQPLIEEYSTPHTAQPRMRVLSNNRYSVVVDNGGVGTSTFEGDIAITRVKDDGIIRDGGTFIYIRDLNSKTFWSTTYLPTKVEPEYYKAIFAPDKIEFQRKDSGVSAVTEITVSPEDNVEIRRVTLRNLTDELSCLEITSYGEVALAPVRADQAHPAFSKLFVQTELVDEYDALLFHRRPRTHSEPELFMMHTAVMPAVWAPTQYETARGNFLGRGRTAHYPLAMENGSKLSGLVGTVLDPIFAVRNYVEIEPGASFQISFITAIGRTRDEVLNCAGKYREIHNIHRAFELAWSHADIEKRNLQYSGSSIADFYRLANSILVNTDAARATSDTILKSNMGQSALWRFGVSGDEAIVLCIINDPSQIKLAEDVLRAHEFLRHRNIRFDLIILNEYQSGYMQDLQHELEALVRAGSLGSLLDQRCGIFLRNITQLSTEEISLLRSSARVIVDGTLGDLSKQHQLTKPGDVLPIYNTRPNLLPTASVSPAVNAPSGVSCWNGWGGFDDNSGSYKISVRNGQFPPAPWSNVIASPHFGFLVTEAGGGFTWSDNSRENRLSSWSNDPVSDPSGEILYIRDQETGSFWSPTPLPVLTDRAYTITHGFGFSSFETSNTDLTSILTVHGHPEDKVKFWCLSLKNQGQHKRSLELFFYYEPVLGVSRSDTFRQIRSYFDPERGTLYFRNPFNIEFGGRIVFVGSDHRVQSYTTRRDEFVGRNGSLYNPGALAQDPHISRLARSHQSSVFLSGTTGAGFDQCGVLKVQITVPAGDTSNVVFYLGESHSIDDYRSKSIRYSTPGSAKESMESVKCYWSNILDKVQVATPDQKFDRMINGWLIYQTLSGRINARSGFYQSSGAFGFRDQLQDSLALMIADPATTRMQILLHASRQFPEGDVQHWWHPPSGKGIRTKISDNYVWLPFAVTEYLEQTGDRSILEESVGFLEGPQLEPEQHDLYFQPNISDKKSSLYTHCCLALDRAITQVTERGLALMGAGDWNDGMNQVGGKGKGESIWLSWFIAHTLNRFSVVAESHDEADRAEKYRAAAAKLVAAVEEYGWDGQWYRRAYFDDGTPVGSEQNAECKIDSLAQSWAALTHLGNPERVRLGFKSLEHYLVDDETKIIRLLTPPFKESDPSPGYIQSYPVGLRENGGQYTHGSVWSVFGAAALGDGDLAYKLFDYLNPITHGDNQEVIQKYKTEPYVTCGDVYDNPQHRGRGGWSWYTGSSGWLYRAGIECILGFKLRGNHFIVEPCLPRGWKDVSLTYKREGSVYAVRIYNPKGLSTGKTQIKVNGETVVDGRVSFAKWTGNVAVEVTLE
jgi:cellobiose phosphorylase